MGFSPGSLLSPDPHRSRLRRWAIGLSLLSHLLFLAFLLWLPPPSIPGERAVTVRLNLAGPPPPPEEPLPPPAERAKRESPPEPPPKPQVKPTPTPSPSARSVQGSPQPPAAEAKAKEGGKAGPEAPRPGKSAKGVGVPGEKARGVQPLSTERKGEVPRPEVEGTAPAPGTPPVESEESAPLPQAAPLGKSGKEERLGLSGGHASPSQNPSVSREGLAARSPGEAGVGADPLEPSSSSGRGLAAPDPGWEERLAPLGSSTSPSQSPLPSREGLAPRSSGKASLAADPLAASPPSGRSLVGPDPLGKGQGGFWGEEAGACALVVDVSAFPFTPNPSPALLDPEGNVVWAAEDRVRGVPGRVVEESGIALFLRKGQFSEKGYAQVLHVRAVGTRPRGPGSRFHDFALLDREGTERVKEVPPFCQVVFLY